MKLVGYLALILLVGFAGFVLYAWTVQNLDELVRLRLDLGFAGAWETAEPFSAPLLLLGTFGVGALLGVLPGLLWGLGQRRRLRATEATHRFDRSVDGL